MPPSSDADEAQHAAAMASHRDDEPSLGLPADASPRPSARDDSANGKADHSDEEEDDDEDEEAERHFKYASLTGRLASIYRKGDSASASLTSGDKLIIATHSGNVHVLSIPSLNVIRTYHAHKASITSISVCPYSPVFTKRPTQVSDPQKEPTATAQRGSVKGIARQVVPATPSNLIHIATSSIDGTVCVSSLVDEKDVTLRNFGRPVQSVALSPEYYYDRSYMSGGLDGSLIITSGGQKGVEIQANVNSIAGSASNWLGQIGLSADRGKDVKVHSGEGAISAITWSLSGRYVAWVNEHGIKIVRSNLFLHPDHASYAWTLICHIDKPNRKPWEDMVGAWKARAHWVDQKHFDKFDDWSDEARAMQKQEAAGDTRPSESPNAASKKTARKTEQLLVGWGDAIWIIEVDPKGQHLAKPGQAPALGKAEVPHRLKLDDCTIAGVTLFTPKTLLVLTHESRNTDSMAAPDTPKKSGIRKRQNGLPARMHLINFGQNHEEIEVEEVRVSKFESLAAADYHLSTLFFTEPAKLPTKQKNALSQFSDGLWGAGVNATTRIFSSGASVLSGSSDDRSSSSTAKGTVTSVGDLEAPSAFPTSYSKPGLKIFVVSAYDCFVGVKRDLSDHMKHLVEYGHFQEAWSLLDAHPEGVIAGQQTTESGRSTPTRASNTLLDFFADDTSSSMDPSSVSNNQTAAVKRERRRIGDMWIKQLTQKGDWSKAAEVAEHALDTPDRWEHWISAFAEADKYDDIVMHVPSKRFKPAISGALYELILGHYAKHDPKQLRHLINIWDASMYDAAPVVSVIQSRIATLQEDSSEEEMRGNETWRSLQACLADLLFADGRSYDAVLCFINAGEAAPAIQLIRENQLYTAIIDHIYAFITMSIHPHAREAISQSEMEQATADPIRLLASGASQGLVSVDEVVQQLQSHGTSANLLIYLYFRAMFNGDTDSEEAPGQAQASRVRRPRFAQLPPTNTTRALLNPCADLVVTLFADFDPPLLNTLIRTNDASATADLSGGALRFTFEHASAVCKARGLTSELVYLLALVGQTRDALHLIVEEMKDVSRAISFAREMADQALWRDLLDYSLDKPAFIRGLLEEVGGGIGEEHDSDNIAIDPLTLVRKIPDGLKIEGLKEALSRILKDGEVQTSISEGAARVLSRDVAVLLDTLNQRRSRGVVFDSYPQTLPYESSNATEQGRLQDPRSVCSICGESCLGDAIGHPSAQDEYLLGFACGHLTHVRCVLDAIGTESNKRQINAVLDRLDEARSAAALDEDSWTRGRVGPKITRYTMLREVLGEYTCQQCEADMAIEDMSAT